jgi:hypothetical protein
MNGLSHVRRMLFTAVDPLRPGLGPLSYICIVESTSEMLISDTLQNIFFKPFLTLHEQAWTFVRISTAISGLSRNFNTNPQ